MYSGVTERTIMSCMDSEAPLRSTDPMFDLFVHVCLEDNDNANMSE